jgi:hypothetical protein
MRDFDQIFEAATPTGEFRFGGETFTFAKRATVDQLAAYVEPNGGYSWSECPHCHERIQIGSTTPYHDSIAAIDTLIGVMLDPGQEERWAAVRSRPGLELRNLREISEYIVEVVSARPTVSPSDSSSTDSASGTRSTESSPSPVAA